MTNASRFTRAAAPAAAAAMALCAVPSQVHAAGNENYQRFFGQTVCANPGVTLFLARCLQTVDANGTPADISQASETSLNPNQTAVAASNSLATARALADQTEGRLEGLRDKDKGKPGADAGTIAGFGPWSIFTNLNGDWFDQSRPANVNERGFGGHRYSGSLGADYRVGSGTRIGLMASYGEYSLNFDREIATPAFVTPADSGGMKAKTVSVIAYVSGSLSANGWIDAAGGVSWGTNDFRRNAVFQPGSPAVPVANTTVTTTGFAHGRQWFASIGAGYDIPRGPLSIGPYARLTYTHSSIDGYAEQEVGTPSGLAMTVSAQEAESLAGIVGLRASYSISTGWGVIVPQLRAEYEHEFNDDARTTITRFVLDPNKLPFSVTNDAPDRNHANLGASLSFVLPHGVVAYVDYEGLIGYQNFSRHRVGAGIRAEL